MTRYRIIYADEYVSSPVSPWVHSPVDSPVWREATRYEPPMPENVPGRGFTRYLLEYRGEEFVFSSVPEIDHVIEVLSLRNLPTTTALSRKSPWMRGYKHLHWLTRWPARLKNRKDRAEIVRLLKLLREHANLEQ